LFPNYRLKQLNIVWRYFTKKEDLAAQCKFCNKIVKHGGNTTNLIQHLQRKHQLLYKEEDIKDKNENSDDKDNPSVFKKIKIASSKQSNCIPKSS